MENSHYNISGKRVKQLRDNYNLTQMDLACETNLEQRVISKIESDKYKQITFCTVVKIARFFNVPIDSLIKK
jgi:transcriptional regulator with XRE-family HTH domain